MILATAAASAAVDVDAPKSHKLHDSGIHWPRSSTTMPTMTGAANPSAISVERNAWRAVRVATRV